MFEDNDGEGWLEGLQRDLYIQESTFRNHGVQLKGLHTNHIESHRRFQHLLCYILCYGSLLVVGRSLSNLLDASPTFGHVIQLVLDIGRYRQHTSLECTA